MSHLHSHTLSHLIKSHLPYLPHALLFYTLLPFFLILFIPTLLLRHILLRTAPSLLPTFSSLTHSKIHPYITSPSTWSVQQSLLLGILRFTSLGGIPTLKISLLATHLFFRLLLRISALPLWGARPRLIGTYDPHHGGWYIRYTSPAAIPKDDILIFYIHGGGYVSGTPLNWLHTMHKWLKTLHQNNVNPLIYDVSYPLAPNHKFPSALTSILKTYTSLVTTSNCKKIILMGDSAGGGLALSLLQRLHTLPETIPYPTSTILSSPWLDLSIISTHPSPTHDILSKTLLHQFITAYTPSSTNLTQPLLSPLYIPPSTPIPNLHIIYGSIELFSTEITRFITTLHSPSRSHPIPVHVEIGKDMPHNYALIGSLLGTPGLTGTNTISKWLLECCKNKNE